jgi:hypothetical protein
MCVSYGGLKLQLYVFLALALDGGEWLLEKGFLVSLA